MENLKNLKNLLLASTSTLYGGDYLEYLLPELRQLFNDTKELVFISFARPSGISHEAYTRIAVKAFAQIDISVRGIHEFSNQERALRSAEGIFVGGGNTFVLVQELLERNLMPVLRTKIEQGTPYLGTSAGSNICGVSMQTTNDMPIAMPASFLTLGSVPFNLNVHYIDPDPDSKHQGETRAVRIKEFHAYNEIPVIGLREGSWLEVKDKVYLRGNLDGKLFKKDQDVIVLEPNTDVLAFL